MFNSLVSPMIVQLIVLVVLPALLLVAFVWWSQGRRLNPGLRAATA